MYMYTVHIVLSPPSVCYVIICLLQLVMEYCLGSASDIIEGTYTQSMSPSTCVVVMLRSLTIYG